MTSTQRTRHLLPPTRLTSCLHDEDHCPAALSTSSLSPPVHHQDTPRSTLSNIYLCCPLPSLSLVGDKRPRNGFAPRSLRLDSPEGDESSGAESTEGDRDRSSRGESDGMDSFFVRSYQLAFFSPSFAPANILSGRALRLYASRPPRSLLYQSMHPSLGRRLPDTSHRPRTFRFFYSEA
jgi:hypothetical protein